MLDAVADAILDLPVVWELVAHEAAVLFDERAVLLLLCAGDAVEGVLANVELAVELESGWVRSQGGPCWMRGY